MGLGLGARRLAAEPQSGSPPQAATDCGAFGPLNLSSTGRDGGAQSPHSVTITAPRGHGPDLEGASCFRGPGRLDG